MKTTLHLHRGAAVPAPTRAVRPSILRLGLAVSAVAALAAVVIEAVADVPAVAVITPVVVVGFALSWAASGRHEQHTDHDDRRAG
jgi:hypothetical protein